MTGAPRDHTRALYGAAVSSTAGNFCRIGRPYRDQHILLDFKEAVEVTGTSHDVAMRRFRWCLIPHNLSCEFVFKILLPVCSPRSDHIP